MMSTRLARSLGLVLVVSVVSLSTTACNRFGFNGHIEEIIPATNSKYGPSVTVTGWVQARTTTPWQAFVTLNGMVPAGPIEMQSDTAQPRPDVEAKHGGHAGGIFAAFSPPPRGVYHVCLHVVPQSMSVPTAGEIPGEGSDVVDCGWLIQGRDWTERAHIERFSQSGGVVTLEGWVRFTPANFKFIGVSADGRYVEPISDESVDRPDVDAVYGEGTIGFRYTVPDDPSVTRWCVATVFWNGQSWSPLGLGTELDCANRGPTA